MLRTVIIDDEERSRKNLAALLSQECPNVEIVGYANSATSGIERIKKHNPDVIFLDVEMPNGTGFDLLENIEEIDFQVIFTTAYNHYAVKAIKFSALDYLLKPIDIKELKLAVEKAEKRIDTHAKGTNAVLKNFSAFSGFHKIALPTNKGLVLIQVNEIIRCEASGSYTFFWFIDGKKMLVSKNIKEYEDLLVDHDFFRVHKSHLINISHVKKYLHEDGGYVVMADNSKIEVSRRKKDEFLRKLS